MGLIRSYMNESERPVILTINFSVTLGLHKAGGEKHALSYTSLQFPLSGRKNWGVLGPLVENRVDHEKQTTTMTDKPREMRKPLK
jgi:hypothetical protein